MFIHSNNIKPAPKHDSYLGALWGGAKTAAGNVATTLGHAVSPNRTGGSKRSFSSRLRTLKFIPGSISAAFRAHTMSFHDPEGFAKTNAAIARFQQGRVGH